MTVVGNSVSCFCSSSDAVITMTDVFPWLCVWFIYLLPSSISTSFTLTLEPFAHTQTHFPFSLLLCCFETWKCFFKIWNHFSPHCLINSCLVIVKVQLRIILCWHYRSCSPVFTSCPFVLLFRSTLWSYLLSGSWMWEPSQRCPEHSAAVPTLTVRWRTAAGLSRLLQPALICHHLKLFVLQTFAVVKSAFVCYTWLIFFFSCILFVCILTEGPGKKVQLSKDIQKKNILMDIFHISSVG